MSPVLEHFLWSMVLLLGMEALALGVGAGWARRRGWYRVAAGFRHLSDMGLYGSTAFLGVWLATLLGPL